MIVIFKRGTDIRIFRDVTEFNQRNIGGIDHALVMARGKPRWFTLDYLSTYDEAVVIGGGRFSECDKLRWVIYPTDQPLHPALMG